MNVHYDRLLTFLDNEIANMPQTYPFMSAGLSALSQARICPYSAFFRHFVMNTTGYLQSQVVCFSVSYVCIVCPFVNFERFTNGSLLKHSRSSQTPGVSPAELEDLDGIKLVTKVPFLGWQLGSGVIQLRDIHFVMSGSLLTAARLAVSSILV